MIDWPAVDRKWRDMWKAEGEFEADPDERPKKFITVAYPYPNSPQHIGHGRTYTLADVHARYYRMLGYNVLFPMGFHYTGTPILAMAKRVVAGDPEIMDGLRNAYDIPDKVIAEFTDPVRIADYFREEIKSGMIEMGYSIDWRREFTTIDPAYSKFIEWQVEILREKNLIIQGSHPVGWCPQDSNPVSQHDTLGDVEPSFTEYDIMKFKMDGRVIPTATLRPETIFGVTNLWVNPDVTYVTAMIDGEKWVISRECARKMQFLGRTVSIEGEIPGRDLINSEVETPQTGRRVTILGAKFVDPGTGTGLVMSVPAHAPFDWQALDDLRRAEDGTASAIEPVLIIETPGCASNPAMEACRRLDIKSQDDPRLEEATSEVYAKEFNGGVMNYNAGRFAGQKAAEARDAIREWLAQEGSSDSMTELSDAVRCRCGSICLVKVLSDQWFLNYGDEAWKRKAAACLDKMGILPPEIRGEFDHTLGWLRERACARQQGLGTRLPWDEDWTVESLSDSVIYMAFYLISKFVNSGRVRAGDLSRGFFDYILLGRGDEDAVSADTGIPVGTLRDVRREFAYFYPVDSRHSGRDLVPNHLTFFILNHAAIFPEHDWPREIVVNGSVLMGGKKMSKSMGNIIPLRQAIRRYGADPIRLAIILSAELLQDADFSADSVAGIRSRLESLCAECSESDIRTPAKLHPEDRWILSRMNGMIPYVSSAIEKMRLREALQHLLFSFDSEMRWYLRRARAKGRKDTGGVIRQVNAARVAMFSPFAPHAAEEMWERMAMPGTASRSRWPEPSEDSIDREAIQSEELLMRAMDDIAHIVKVTKMTPKRITLYTAGEFKRRVYHSILYMVTSGETGMGPIMKHLISDPETGAVKADPGLARMIIRDILSEPEETRKARLDGDVDEQRLYSEELAGLAGTELKVDVNIFSESDPDAYDPAKKARHARPFKPAIFLE